MSDRATALEVLRRSGVLVGDDGGARLHLRTSGTTTGGRTVVRTPESWLDSFDPFTELARLSDEDSVLIPAPPTSSSLFAFALAHTAYVGARAHVLRRWSVTAAADAAGRCSATHLTPPMLAALLDRLPSDHTLTTAVVAGARTPELLRRRAAARGIHVVDYYGAAELSFVAIRHRDGHLREFPGVEVDLRGGVVWVRSPFVSQGYLPGQRGPFRTTDGWSTVGDHAVWGEDGLEVTGRGSDAIQSGGTTVLPEDVERALLTIPGVREAVACGLPHPSLGHVVAAFLVTDGPVTRRALQDAAAVKLRPEHLPRRWFTVSRLPLTDAGKVSRSAVAAGLRDGTLHATRMT